MLKLSSAGISQHEIKCKVKHVKLKRLGVMLNVSFNVVIQIETNTASTNVVLVYS